MTALRVSVLMPIHNGQAFLHEAVQSVVDQTLSDWELVAVLDRCTDNSEQIIRQFQDDRIRVFEAPSPGGFAVALNFGLSQCRADLVARLDHDDVCMPNRLAEQSEILAQRPALALLGTYAQIIDESSRIIGLRSVATGVRSVGFALLWRNQLIHPSVMFRRSVILNVGGYDPNAWPIFEDYDLWLRVVGHGEIDNLIEPLIAYRRHTRQWSRVSRLSSLALATLSKSRRQAGSWLGVPGFALQLLDAYWFLTQMIHRVFVVGWKGRPRAVQMP
jgi:GT2 family glycosyltransferase